MLTYTKLSLMVFVLFFSPLSYGVVGKSLDTYSNCDVENYNIVIDIGFSETSLTPYAEIECIGTVSPYGSAKKENKSEIERIRVKIDDSDAENTPQEPPYKITSIPILLR